MNTKNAFIQRIVAFVFVAVFTLSAFGVSLGQSAVGNNSASFAPVSVAYAAEDNGPGGIFDAIVSDPDKNGNITITKPDQSDDWKPAQLVSKSKAIAMIFTGICTVVALCFVIFTITTLGAADGRPDHCCWVLLEHSLECSSLTNHELTTFASG